MVTIVIEATDLSFDYGDGPIVDSIDISIDAGDCVLFCGPSGCGKTTLAKCLSGIIPTLDRHGEMNGTVELDGTPTTELSKTDLAMRVDAVLEDPDAQIIGLSVEEDIAFGCENLGMDEESVRATVERMLELLGLTDYRGQDPRHLSGGEKQRLAIASAIAKDPDVLLLDEPVSQLDPSGVTTALEMIQREKEQGKTILLLARKLGQEIRIADRVCALNDGEKVVDTTPRQFLADTQLLEELGMWFPDAQSARRHRSTDTEGQRECNLRVENLWYSYVSDAGKSADTDWALKDVSIEIPKGKIVGLVGHNGSGKTTLSKQLNRLYSPNSGRITFRGQDITERSTSDVAGHVGYVFQNPDTQIFTTTVRKEVEYGPQNLGYNQVDERVETALQQVNLLELIDERIATLSRGQRQRVAIASVLALDPEVLILDEPSSGVDYQMFWDIMTNLIGNFLISDRSVVLISHDPDVIRGWADEVIELADGEKKRQIATPEMPRDDHWGGELRSPSRFLNRLDEPFRQEANQ